jgi:hypothetical protein
VSIPTLHEYEEEFYPQFNTFLPRYNARGVFDINVPTVRTLQHIIVEASTVLQGRKLFQILLRMAIAVRAMSTRKRGKVPTRESPFPGYR